MSDSKKILEYLQKENDNFVELLKTVVEMESPTYGDKELTDKCGRFFQELYKELGFEITVLPQTTCGDHFIAELGEGEKPSSSAATMILPTAWVWVPPCPGRSRTARPTAPPPWT